MDTIIRPISGRYDLDLGVYFSDLTGNPKDWPRTETIHRHIADAVRGQTSIKPIDKAPCVRLIYKSPYPDNSDLSYHIDLPVYAYKKSFWNSEIQTVIGYKGEKQWSELSNPSQFQSWFTAQANLNVNDPKQLNRIVKYLKAWKSVQPKSPKIPDGMLLTVLMAKNYQPDLRDDISFYKTIKAFYNRVWWMFSVIKPVEPKNDLAEELTKSQRSNFLKRIKKLMELSKKAIETQDDNYALKIWNQVFRKRFICD